MKLWSKLHQLFRRGKLDAEMAAEMRAHLEMQEAANRAAGMSSDEARYAARRQFGHLDGIKERCREIRGIVWLDQLLQDVRYGVRALRKTPSFTITAMLTLALGIGVNAALFTVYNIVALRPLPVRDPDSLVRIGGQRHGAYYPGFSYAEFLAYREGNRSLADLVAVVEASARLDRDGAPVSDAYFQGRNRDMISVQYVSENYFSTLGASMALGRGFLPEENASPGAASVVVLSHLFWTRYFASDPRVLGSTVLLHGKPYTVVGVTAPEFAGQQPAPPACWLPLMMWGPPSVYGPKGVPAFRLIGRLRPEVTLQQAKADLDVIATRLVRELPSDEAKDSVRLERGMRFIDIPVNAKTVAATLPLVLGFAMVLAIACTNVANLLLARGVTRQQEMGVRLTLGAGRWRVIRQLLTENLMLCTGGALLGLGAAVWTLQLLRPVVLARLTADWAMETRRWYFLDVTPDWRVFGFTALLTVIAVIAAGLIPAWHTSRASLASSLKQEGSIFGRQLSQSRLRSLLVIAQVAICLMLLSCVGLLARNLMELRKADVGFDAHSVMWISAMPKAPTADRRAVNVAAVAALNTLPGVEAAALASDAPLFRVGGVGLVRPGSSADAGAPIMKIRSYMVGAEFFRCFGLPISQGRGFRPEEIGGGARVALVSESTARRFWPGQVAMGKTIGVSESSLAGPGAPWTTALAECEVIGVVHDVMSDVFRNERDAVYLPLSERGQTLGAMFLRLQTDSPAALREIARQADAAGWVLRPERRLSDFHDEQMLPFSGVAALSGLLGGLALLMASVGLYGVMAFGVNQRVREIGNRMALGATAEKVVTLFVRQGMRLVGVGMALGLGASALFTLLLKKILSGLPGIFDPWAFGGVTFVFVLIALTACWLPARRAAKVDPINALRAE